MARKPDAAKLDGKSRQPPLALQRARVAAAAWLLLCGCLLASRAMAVDCRPETLAGVQLTVCRVNLAHDRLALFRADASGQAFGSFDALRAELASQHKLLGFAMNAGMYEPDRSPVGLFVADGRELAPLNLRSGAGNFYQDPNGVLLWDRRRARVMASYQYVAERPRPLFATQSGPMLVHQGQITTSPFMSPQSTSRKIRNGVCVPAPSTVVFVISEQPVTFHEFATVFRDALKCSEALYLDGTISSLYFPALQRDDQRDRLGPMGGVVAAAKR
jgi:uncharacterized protein YigE (DUF2233 family)